MASHSQTLAGSSQQMHSCVLLASSHSALAMLLDSTEFHSEASKKMLVDKCTDEYGDVENHPLVRLIPL